MEPLRVGRCLREGWRLFGRRRRLLFLMWVVASAIYLPVTLAGSAWPADDLLGLTVQQFFLVLYAVVYAGLLRSLVLEARGRPCGFPAMFQGTKRFWELIGVQLLLTLRLLVVLLPVVCFLVIGTSVWAGAGTDNRIVLSGMWIAGGAASAVLIGRVALRYSYAGLLLLDEDLGISDSFRRSAEITQGSLLRLLAMETVLFLAGAPAAAGLVFSLLYLPPLAGWATVCVGGFVLGVLLGPWAAASQVVAYRTLHGEASGKDTAETA